MTQRPAHIERVAQLVGVLLDGELSAAEHAELAGLLRADTQARAMYLDLLAAHAHLRQELGAIGAPELKRWPVTRPGPPPSQSLSTWLDDVGIEPAAPPPAAAPILAPPVSEDEAPWFRQVARIAAHPATLAASVAAVVITAGLLGLALWSPSGGGLAAVATVTRTTAAQWVEGSGGVIEGDALHSGHELNLLAGQAEITYRTGATIVLAAPVRYTVGSNKGRLEQGALSAYVPPEAAGFAVETADAEIVDLGTRFGASVVDHLTEVAVFDGRIEVRPDRRYGKAGQPLALAADETLQMNHATGRYTRNAAIDMARFVRVFVPMATIAKATPEAAAENEAVGESPDPYHIEAEPEDGLLVGGTLDPATQWTNRVSLGLPSAAGTDTPQNSIAQEDSSGKVDSPRYRLTFTLDETARRRLADAKKIELVVWLYDKVQVEEVVLDLVGVQFVPKTSIPKGSIAVNAGSPADRQEAMLIPAAFTDAVPVQRPVAIDVTRYVREQAASSLGTITLDFAARAAEASKTASRESSAEKSPVASRQTVRGGQGGGLAGIAEHEDGQTAGTGLPAADSADRTAAIHAESETGYVFCTADWPQPLKRPALVIHESAF